MSIESKLLEVVKKKGVYVVISNEEKYHQVNKIIISLLVKKLKKKGVYVTFNKEAEELKKELGKEKIDISKILFVDGITKKRNSLVKDSGNIMYIQGPTSLTELSLVLTSATNNGGFDFILMDSLSTLLMYNKPEIAERFSHYLITKIKDYELNTILLSIDEDKSNKIIGILSQFCDGVIKI